MEIVSNNGFVTNHIISVLSKWKNDLSKLYTNRQNNSETPSYSKSVADDVVCDSLNENINVLEVRKAIAIAEALKHDWSGFLYTFFLIYVLVLVRYQVNRVKTVLFLSQNLTHYTQSPTEILFCHVPCIRYIALY